MNIRENVWKISGASNCYLIRSDEDILIDTGAPEDKDLVKLAIEKISSLKNIKKILFTHLHYDHIANHHLFSDAKLYASGEAIIDLKKNPFATVLNKTISSDTLKRGISPIVEIKDITCISTPGHTRGSVCYIFEDVIFTGDTLFFRGAYGRTDLPTSCPERMKGSLNKLKEYSRYILCPGHDY